METTYPSPAFDDIRPVNDAEVPQAVEDLISSDGLWRALSYIAPDADRAAPRLNLSRPSATRQSWPLHGGAPSR